MEQEAVERERRAFLHWMRTGRILPDDAVRAEWKFNPWHDPHNGQFTSGPSGSGGGHFTGGGGSFGGAGAQGSWGNPSKSPAPSHARAPAPASAGSRKRDPQLPVFRAVAVARASAAHHRASNHRDVHTRNGYRFETDGLQRTADASGNLTLGRASPRSRLAQARAGGKDRRPGDDGGHFIAHRFNGPSDSFNHFAQNARFNRGGYRAIEDEWARAKRAGKNVFVHITPTYPGTSLRPSAIRVEWTIDGHTSIKTFKN